MKRMIFSDDSAADVATGESFEPIPNGPTARSVLFASEAFVLEHRDDSDWIERRWGERGRGKQVTELRSDDRAEGSQAGLVAGG